MLAGITEYLDEEVGSAKGNAGLLGILECRVNHNQKLRDLPNAIAVLASGRLGYMTGAALVVDGGWTVL